MGLLSLVGPAVSLASSAASGKGGGSTQAPSGISPQEAALANYTMTQGLVRAGEQFAETGTGESTMATQAAGGARNRAALQGATLSDLNQGAQGSALQQLANIAGTQAGQAASAGQGFTSSPGSLGTGGSTDTGTGTGTTTDTSTTG